MSDSDFPIGHFFELKNSRLISWYLKVVDQITDQFFVTEESGMSKKCHCTAPTRFGGG